jgi:hypothetical protein
MTASASIILTATSIADAAKSVSATIAIAVAPPPIIVSVSPQTDTLAVSQTQNFIAFVQNDTQTKGVTWTISGTNCNANACGTLSSNSSPSGTAITYTAPSQMTAPASIILTATSVADPAKFASAAIAITVAPPPIIVTVSPQTQTLAVNQTQNFMALVQNDSQNMGVTWNISGTNCNANACGTLSTSKSPSGTAIIYTAPANIPNSSTVTLTATSMADSKASANSLITIVRGAPPVTVAVSPAMQTVPVSHPQTFTATVRNDPQSMGVTWTLSGAGCTGVLCGTLSNNSSKSGAPITYTAPPNAPNPPTVTLTATSVTDSKSSASATITVFPISDILGVTISPLRGGMTTSQTLRFSASVQNDPTSLGVTWTASSGTFSDVAPTSATYHPPSNPGVFVITATSVLNIAKRASSTIGVTSLSGVTTYHNDGTRAGVNSQEFALTTSNVHASTFAKLFACQVDSPIYTQTLWVPNLSIDGGMHNVIFTATSHDTVYAFDADANPCVTYWSKNLVPAGETWPTAVDMGGDDIWPVTGVVGTPVIDPATNILYVVTKTKTTGTSARGPGECHQRLHALHLSDGTEAANSPLALTSAITVPGSGDGGNGTAVPFDPFHENQRPGLALVGNTIYVAWASYIDQKPWHGWIIGFDKSTLRPAFLFNATPNGYGGGIWMAGAAPSIDSTGNLYVITSNGDYNGRGEFSDSFVKLNPNLVVQDWFTPADEALMESGNGDLGAGGAAVLADLPNAPIKHLLIGGGKIGSGQAGELYVTNRDAMGHLEGAGGPPLVQKFPLTRHIFATPAFWNNTLYIAGRNGPLSAFALDPATALFNTTPVSQSAALFNGRGATPSVSSNGNSHGIVWAVDTSQSGASSGFGIGPAVLHAYDATNLARELWNSSQAAANRDQAGNSVKFTVPTIANGKVYIGSFSEIDVYGLLPD